MLQTKNTCSNYDNLAFLVLRFFLSLLLILFYKMVIETNMVI